MNLKILFALLLFFPHFTEAAASSPIVGTWEMVRVDAVHPMDIPPYGFINLLVEFSPQGTAESWFPGIREQSEPGPYSFDGSELTAWLGMSNDFETPRPISFHGTDWLEITIPEGSTATFKRIEGPTTERRCVFFTVVEENYDPKETHEIKKRLFSFRAGELPSGLSGTWRNLISDESEGDYESILQIAKGIATVTVRSLEFPDIPPEVVSGPVLVSGESLQSPAIFCGALSSFQLTETTLVIRPDSKNSLAFERVVK